MVQLTANLSAGLIELLQSEAVSIEALEVGPWFSVEQIRHYQQMLPGWKFYFHHSNLISRLKWVAGTAELLQGYLQCTQSPWISTHYSLLPPGHVWLAARFGWYLPPPDPVKAAQWFTEQVAKLKQLSELPVLLENMPSFPTRKYAFETAAESISEILNRTYSMFLLDLAHARVTASVFNLDVHEYLSNLPLEKVVQIHVSGPRFKNGHLNDAHEDLQDEDYLLLEWVLRHTNPQMVTLEYFKDRQKLYTQLIRLQKIIASANSAGANSAREFSE